MRAAYGRARADLGGRRSEDAPHNYEDAALSTVTQVVKSLYINIVAHRIAPGRRPTYCLHDADPTLYLQSIAATAKGAINLCGARSRPGFWCTLKSCFVAPARLKAQGAGCPPGLVQAGMLARTCCSHTEKHPTPSLREPLPMLTF